MSNREKQVLDTQLHQVQQRGSLAPAAGTSLVSPGHFGATRRSVGVRPHGEDDNTWKTTNEVVFGGVQMPDLSVNKLNYRKKTPFTIWSNAFFHGGVFFNPHEQGL